jgi:hypothetical protein
LLRRNLGDGGNLSWALDINNMIFEASLADGAACVVELDSKSNQFAEQCQRLSLFSNNPYGARLFVVGDNGLNTVSSIFRQLDVAFICHSAMRVLPLVETIHRHHQSQSLEPISIETWAEQNLPWQNQSQF